MLYLLQATTYTGLMYMVYILFLRNRPMHTFNRIYLLCAAVLPFALPFIRFQTATPVLLQQATLKGIRLPELVVGQEQQYTATYILYAAIIIYITVSIILLSINLWQWYRLAQVVKQNNKERHDGYTLVLHTGYGPGSWHRYIFLPAAEQHETIIQHELAHINLRHTADLILLNLLQVCFWPNVFLVFIRKELAQVHEFQADAIAGTEKSAYAELLVSSLFTTCTLPSSHSFIIHPIKRRIKMLNKKNKILPRIAAILATGVSVTFLLANIIGIQSCNTKKWDAARKTDKVYHWFKGNDTALFVPTGNYVDFKKGEVKQNVYKMPSFTGNMAEFLAQTIVYPKDAIEKGVQGRVVVKFVVSTDGSVVNADVVSSPDPFLSVAAIDVVTAMPKWTPGETETGEKVPVEYVLPVMFKL